MTSLTDAASNLTAYGFDTENRLASITDALGRVRSFAYDSMGHVTSVKFPSALGESYTYDAMGNLVSKTDRKGQTIDYAYDNLDRLTSKTYPDSSAVNYTYDALSRLIGASDPTGAYSFTYDNMGRLTGTGVNYSFLSSQNLITAYTYDAASNRASFTDPQGGVAANTYDTLNRLTALKDYQGKQFTFAYDSLGRRTSFSRPNGITTNYQYDALSRSLSLLHQLGSSTLDGASYNYDSAGNRTSLTRLPGNTASNFSYDPLYELTQVAQSGTTTETYSYDAVGNRLTSLGVSSYTYNSSNELASQPGVTYTYDANGNVTSKATANGTTTYRWDYENRLAGMTLPGSGGTLAFKYDPFGRRVYLSSSAGTNMFVYDGQNMVTRLYGGGTVLARYTQGLGIDEPLAEYLSGTPYYYEADGLGSVTSLSNASGAVANTYGYDSFGRLTTSTGTVSNWFRYTGREYDTATGLYYYRARYYDPQVGRFLSEDPIGFLGGLDFYSYVGSNPALWVDPTGLSPLSYDQIAKLVSANNKSGQSNELIVCMAYEESSFDPAAVQVPPNTARGLLGVTKGAAQDLGINYSTLADSGINIYAGTRYLYRRINWRPPFGAGSDVRQGLAAYGEGLPYADSLLKCEACLKTESGESVACKTKDCLLPLHGGR